MCAVTDDLRQAQTTTITNMLSTLTCGPGLQVMLHVLYVFVMRVFIPLVVSQQAPDGCT